MGRRGGQPTSTPRRPAGPSTASSPWTPTSWPPCCGTRGRSSCVTLDQELTADNAVPFLLRDQYVVAEDKADRIDALAEAASITFDALLGDALPEPITIARDLGPLAAERRLLVWSADAEEQALLERVHLAGQIPPLGRRRRVVVHA